MAQRLFSQDRSGEIIKDDIFQRLMTFLNVLVTGHQGFFTVEVLRKIVGVTHVKHALLAGRLALPEQTGRGVSPAAHL